MELEVFLCRSDNYGVLIRDAATGMVASIDAPDAQAIIAALDRCGWRLDHILITHQHFDHIEGIPALVERYGARVTVPLLAKDAVPQADHYVGEGDIVTIGAMSGVVWAIPGHCDDHISYYFAGEKTIFVGDTLFVMGCGRVLGSTPEALYASLMRLAGLPEETMFYCGHEYTLANARFCASIEPDNIAITRRLAAVEETRKAGQFTVPSTIGAEKHTNVFLRAKDLAEFAARREAKNRA